MNRKYWTVLTLMVMIPVLIKGFDKPQQLDIINELKMDVPGSNFDDDGFLGGK